MYLFFGRLSIIATDSKYSIPDEFKKAINALGNMYYSPVINEDYIEIVTKDGIPRMVLKREMLPGGKTDAAIFGVDVETRVGNEYVPKPARDIVPDLRTVGCVGMHTRVKQDQLRAIMDRTNFHPAEINALTLSALLTLDVMGDVDVGPNPS